MLICFRSNNRVSERTVTCESMNEPQREKSYLLIFSPSEDSNQPSHPRCLISVFVVQIKKLCILGCPNFAQWWFWSACVFAQADLSLRWAHMSEYTFTDVSARRSYQKRIITNFKQSHPEVPKDENQLRTTVLSKSLGKTFLAWRFILNENILFWLTILDQKSLFFFLFIYLFIYFFFFLLLFCFWVIVGKSHVSEQFRKLINRYKRIGYSLDIMRQTACLVVKLIIVDGYASLFNCTTAVRASNSMTASS